MKMTRWFHGRSSGTDPASKRAKHGRGMAGWFCSGVTVVLLVVMVVLSSASVVLVLL